MSRSAVVEWQTKHIASWIASTIPADPKKDAKSIAAREKSISDMNLIPRKKTVKKDDVLSDKPIRVPLSGDVPKDWNDPSVFIEQGSQIADNSSDLFDKLANGVI